MERYLANGWAERQPMTRVRTLYIMAPIAVLFAASCAADRVVSPAVTRETLTFVAGTPTSLPMKPQVTFQVEVRDDRGNAFSNPSVTWTSSNPAVLSVLRIGQPSTSAVLLPVSPGSAVITASVGTIQLSITVTVRAPGPVDRISLDYVPPQSLGATYQVAWFLFDVDDVVLPSQAPSFASSDPTVVAISASGLVTTVGEGRANISATLNGKLATTSISVLAADHAFFWSDITGMTDLGVPTDYVASRAFAISQSGRVAGSAWTTGGASIRAVVWTAGAAGGARVLRTLIDGSRSEAFGINSAGAVVGYAKPPGGKQHAMLWSASGDVEDLGTLPGADESMALGINDAGQVVGWSSFGTRQQAFVWTRSAGMRVVGLASRSVATAINAQGVIVGMADSLPVILSSPAPGPLRPLFEFTFGTATAVSDDGAVVGTWVLPDDDFGPAYGSVVWFDTNNLPQPVAEVYERSPVEQFSVTGINNSRQIVGTFYPHATLFTVSTGGGFRARSLGTLQRRSQSAATAINNAGQVVGWSGNR